MNRSHARNQQWPGAFCQIIDSRRRVTEKVIWAKRRNVATSQRRNVVSSAVIKRRLYLFSTLIMSTRWGGLASSTDSGLEMD